jgi:hypothetical protein
MRLMLRYHSRKGISGILNSKCPKKITLLKGSTIDPNPTPNTTQSKSRSIPTMMTPSTTMSSALHRSATTTLTKTLTPTLPIRKLAFIHPLANSLSRQSDNSPTTRQPITVRKFSNTSNSLNAVPIATMSQSILPPPIFTCNRNLYKLTHA